MKTPEYSHEVIKQMYNIYQLGIVTSRIKEGIYTIPQMASLKKYFQIAVGFEDTIDHKLHPEPLLFAVRNLKVDPKETVYIGDAESDVLAAKAAGMRVILLAKENFAYADEYASSFKKLPEIIATF